MTCDTCAHPKHSHHLGLYECLVCNCQAFVTFVGYFGPLRTGVPQRADRA